MRKTKVSVFDPNYMKAGVGGRLTKEENDILTEFFDSYKNESATELERKRSVYRNRGLQKCMQPLDQERLAILAEIIRTETRFRRFMKWLQLWGPPIITLLLGYFFGQHK